MSSVCVYRLLAVGVCVYYCRTYYCERLGCWLTETCLESRNSEFDLVLIKTHYYTRNANQLEFSPFFYRDVKKKSNPCAKFLSCVFPKKN
jgi:hypothetical protein